MADNGFIDERGAALEGGRHDCALAGRWALGTEEGAADVLGLQGVAEGAPGSRGTPEEALTGAEEA